MERELLLLGLLRRQDLHGYRLMDFIENNLGACTDLKKPTVYFLLEKMANQGWISASQEHSGRRSRQVYHLTPAGALAFQRLLRENLQSRHPVTFADDIGLLFADALTAAEALPLLETRAQTLRIQLEQLRSAPPHSGGAGLTLEHQLAHLQSETVWLEGVLARLRALPPEQLVSF